MSRVLTSVATMVTIGVLSVVLAFLYQRTAAYLACNGNTTDTTVAVTCEQLRSNLGDIIVLPSDTPAYTTLSDENWSQTAWKQPSCIARPNTASEVRDIIRVLTDKAVPFAIRSGGHSPNPYDASIDSGVLIATDNLNQVTYDAASGLASIGPGARWDAVYTYLDNYNLTVVGGRVMNVGVGGLILGSGLSYLSDLYGLVCDNVVEYEVITRFLSKPRSAY